MLPYVDDVLDVNVSQALHLSAHIVRSQSDMPSGFRAALYLALCRFFKLLVTLETESQPLVGTHPNLILVFDDIQWAGSEDLAFFKSLKSFKLQSTLIVFIFREDEITADIETLSQGSFALRTSNLDQEGILEYLSATMETSSQDDLRTFAALLHTATSGNGQHLQVLLERLYKQQLLRFDWTNLTWVYPTALQPQTSSSSLHLATELWQENLAMISQSERESKWICFVAACLQASGSFQLDLLARVTDNPAAPDVVRSLADSSKLFMRITSASGSDKWTFSHDQIRQAAFSLFPVEVQAENYYRVGKKLFHELQFQSIGLANLNKAFDSGFSPAGFALTIAKLNIEAASQSIKNVAPASALEALHKASQALTKRGDEDVPLDLLFDLNLAYANTHRSLAHFEEAIRWSIKAMETATSATRRLQAGEVHASL